MRGDPHADVQIARLSSGAPRFPSSRYADPGAVLHAAKDLRVYTGYAGWGAGQLDAEIARGDWIVASEGVEAVFDDAPDELWKKLHQRHHRLLTRGGGALPEIAGFTRPVRST